MGPRDAGTPTAFGARFTLCMQRLATQRFGIVSIAKIHVKGIAQFRLLRFVAIHAIVISLQLKIRSPSQVATPAAYDISSKQFSILIFEDRKSVV